MKVFSPQIPRSERFHSDFIVIINNGSPPLMSSYSANSKRLIAAGIADSKSRRFYFRFRLVSPLRGSFTYAFTGCLRGTSRQITPKPIPNIVHHIGVVAIRSSLTKP